MQKTIFITGTDTGVGKTVLTALLLLHLRQNKINALAFKPFCSGSRADVRLLQSLQPGELSDDAMNPFFYGRPLAPMAAAGDGGNGLSIKRLARGLKKAGRGAEVVLVEGAGGLLVPLAKGAFIVDLIEELKSEVFLVSRNQLGTINHTLLSVELLRQKKVGRLKIILMDPAKKDPSSRSNERILKSLLPGIEIFHLPFFAKKPNKTAVFNEIEKKYKKTLARMTLHH